MEKKLISKELLVYIVIIIIALVFTHHMNVVASKSMEPTLYTGDIVLINYNPSSIQVGDIVVYHAIWFPEPVIHRVIAKQELTNNETVYITKGDNNPVQDPYPIYSQQVISKVITLNNKPILIPKIGYITLWFQKIPQSVWKLITNTHDCP